MLLRFNPLSAIRDFQRPTFQVRRPDRRAGNQARFRLEGLEERCLLSGISSITEFPLPSGSFAPYGITAGPDGNLWFTESGANAIGMINPTTHAISSFTVPTANAGPYGITAGPDGNLWFTEWRRRQDRDDQPDHPRHQRVHSPRRQYRLHQGDHGGPRRQPLVQRDRPRDR